MQRITKRKKKEIEKYYNRYNLGITSVSEIIALYLFLHIQIFVHMFEC